MRQVDGTAAVCGILGNPVAHSISPQIHNTLAEDLDQDLVYVPLGVADPSLLGEAVRGAFAMGMLGLNVTVPYKKDVIPFLCSLDPLAEKIGSVNTLVRTKKGYRGYNTDIIGMRRTLAACGVALAGRNVLLIGAGGAARTGAFLAASEGAGSLVILNRTEERAESLAGDIRAQYPDFDVQADRLDSLPQYMEKGHWIVLQCTSAGLYPHEQESPLDGVPGARELAGATDFAFDVIYRPEETMFLRNMREAGVRTVNGMRMLLYQGIAAFELWTRTEVDAQEAAKLLKMMRQQV